MDLERRQPSKLLVASAKKAMMSGARELEYGFLEELIMQVKQEL